MAKKKAKRRNRTLKIHNQNITNVSYDPFFTIGDWVLYNFEQGWACNFCPWSGSEGPWMVVGLQKRYDNSIIIEISAIPDLEFNKGENGGLLIRPSLLVLCTKEGEPIRFD